MPKTPKQQLDGFLAKFDPKVSSTAKTAMAKLRKLVPGATELVYDNYNALAIGFGPSERASEAIFSIALYPRYASLFFLQGAGLPDPHKRLEGKGKVARHVKLPSAKVLDDAQILELMELAKTHATVPFRKGSKRKLIIKSVSSKQRPRKSKTR